jgi:hypothetical protein
MKEAEASSDPPVDGSGGSGRSASPASSPTPTPWGTTIAVVLLLAAAWLAAGSTGLLAHPLRKCLVWLALGGGLVAAAASLPALTFGRVLTLLSAAGLGVWLTASTLYPGAVLAATVVAAILASISTPPSRAWFRVTAASTLLFAVYRLLYLAGGDVWIWANDLGTGLGNLGAALAGRALWVGATFAGIDFLVLTSAFVLVWLLLFPGPRLARGLTAGAGVLIGQGLYLVLLAAASDLRPSSGDAAAEGGWFAALLAPTVDAMRWSWPTLAGIVQLAGIGLVLRWTRDHPKATTRPAPAGPRGRRRLAAALGAVALAILLPLVTTLSTASLSLQGKKLVLYEKLFGNFDKPEWGSYGWLSSGMYGMLQPYVESLGGSLVRSEDLSETDLADADVLLVIYPHRPWEEGQLERIEDFVREGGGLLVMGEHTTTITPTDAIANAIFAEIHRTTGVDVRDDYSAEIRVTEAAKKARYALSRAASTRIDLENLVEGAKQPRHFRMTLTREQVEGLTRGLTVRSNYFNQVLAPTAMEVRFDSATFRIGGWLHSYTALAHPTTLGIADDRNQFGAVIGASVAVSRPARPLLVGKWGWNDPGDVHAGSSQMGNSKYDAGEKLGDVVLAAEQRFGDGVVIAFGDTSGLTNAITTGAYDFTSRLFGYLANRPGGPQSRWRQLLAVLLGVALIVLLFNARPALLALVAVVLAAVLSWATERSYRNGVILPGRLPESAKGASQVAYVDTTHMERFDSESWRPDGVAGLKLSLMRAGFVTFELRDFTRERVERASFLVSIAPQRTFTPEEREIVGDFVRAGGVFILSAGYPDRRASQALLEDFGMAIGAVASEPGLEPQPLGRFKFPYLDAGDYLLYVRFYSVWPVDCIARDAPPTDWRSRKRLTEPGVRRLGNWYLSKALAAVFPWMQPTEPATVVVRGTGEVPVILRRTVGKGSVVLIGDSYFLMNRNLELEGGQAFEGLRENPHFLRFLLSTLRTPEKPWIPPEPVPETPPGEER